MNIVFLISLFLFPSKALAHGIGQRVDLPIPLDIYLGAAAVVVIASFFLIGVLGKREKTYESYPSVNLLRYPWVRTLVVHPRVQIGIKAVSAALFFVFLYAGFWGNQSPIHNLFPIFVWVGFTVAITYIVAFVGNIWELINPWKILHEWLDGKERFSLKRAWPVWLGVWPAFALFLIFRFLENVYPYATEPRTLAWLVVSYSVITGVGMIVFGRRQWLHSGDPFAVFFRFLSQFAIVSWEKRNEQHELRLRLPAVGLLKIQSVSVSEIAFVLLMLTTVSFDGISSTALAAGILNYVRDVGMSLVVAKTILLFAVFALFVSVYYVFSILIRNYAHSDVSTLVVAKSFVLSLLPIAIVYEVAHFSALLLTEGQRVFILISDPFGYGWNIFGTAMTNVNYGFLDFRLLWNIEIVLILLGHVASIYIAHMVAVGLFKDSRVALRSQIPMLILMISYTVMGLWILAQPPVLIS